ncbi:aminoglycoside phosphotransferase family protein [Salinibius halmophilus]|uniref:aminoglycoside phosphotransferase family protein n=1 Tax=Salinibius halmophilus TaxID=1853216 RepID=UPI000E66CCB7|nr:aminoglycoside phosphotransferase family protein [Salinibius halmophilus]
MVKVSQGFYGTVYKAGTWAVKDCVSAVQCQQELQAIALLQRFGFGVARVERISDTKYRYPWCEGLPFSRCADAIEDVIAHVNRLHKVKQSHFHWAGISDRHWWRCFTRWVVSWYANIKPLVSARLYLALVPLLSALPRHLATLQAIPTLVHGDPHPDNIIVDGKRIVLIDPGIAGFAVPELDWAMYWRAGFELPNFVQQQKSSVILMRIMLDLWHMQRTTWRDEAYFESFINDYYLSCSAKP